MPTTNSAKKRLRQDNARRIINRAGRAKLRTLVKKVRTAAEAGDVEAAKTAFRDCQEALDRAGVKRLIHPNSAARLKSRLAKAIVRGKADAKKAAAS
jgi:small subunit ribosomal protein S20